LGASFAGAGSVADRELREALLKVFKWCDADGDGKMSVFVSSRDSPPEMTSPDDHL
jgi:hypothetical protein